MYNFWKAVYNKSDSLFFNIYAITLPWTSWTIYAKTETWTYVEIYTISVTGIFEMIYTTIVALLSG